MSAFHQADTVYRYGNRLNMPVYRTVKAYLPAQGNMSVKSTGVKGNVPFKKPSGKFLSEPHDLCIPAVFFICADPPQVLTGMGKAAQAGKYHFKRRYADAAHTILNVRDKGLIRLSQERKGEMKVFLTGKIALCGVFFDTLLDGKKPSFNPIIKINRDKKTHERHLLV
jgi:hypothetical protein